MSQHNYQPPPRDPYGQENYRQDEYGHDPYQQDGYGHYPPAPMKNSGIGTAAMFTALGGLVIGGLPFLFLVAWGFTAASSGGAVDEDNPLVAVGGCGILLGLLLCLIAVVLGIIGCFAAQAKKTHAVIGLIIGGVVLLSVGGLTLLGMIINAAGG